MPTCGNCGKVNATVAEIRECYGRGTTLGAQQSSFEDYLAEEVQTPEPAITDGMWRTPDGVIYKVQVAVHGSGRLYGKRLALDPVEFVYEPGVVGLLQRERAHKLTLEEAKEFGALYGVCCVCGRTLTNETSIAEGIGPVCSGRLA